MKKFIKIFSCTIVVISMVLLFFNWIELTPETKKSAVEIYNSAAGSDQQVNNFAQLNREIKKIDFDEILGINDQSSVSDISVNALYQSSGVKRAVFSIMDGGLNTTEMAHVSLTAGKFYRYIEAFGSLLESAFSGKSAAQTGGRAAALSAYGIIVTILIIISILSAIATFIVRLVDKYERFRKYDLIFFISQLILFILAIVFAGSANSLISSFPLLAITAWSIIAVIFACPSILLEKLPFAKLEEYTGRGTVANETFNRVSDGFNEAVGKISDKVGETQNSMRLGQELRSNEEDLNAKYQDLGKKYYEEHKADPPEEHKDAFSTIKDSKEQIDAIQKDLDTARNVVACPECGTRWNIGAAYCAHCGTKLPEIDQEERRPRREKAENEFCKYCGAKVESSDAFCPACGKSL